MKHRVCLTESYCSKCLVMRLCCCSGNVYCRVCSTDSTKNQQEGRRCVGEGRRVGHVRVSHDRTSRRGRGLAVQWDADPAGAAQLQNALWWQEVGSSVIKWCLCLICVFIPVSLFLCQTCKKRFFCLETGKIQTGKILLKSLFVLLSFCYSLNCSRYFLYCEWKVILQNYMSEF